MDVFAEHAVAGIVGLIFCALFGADYIIGLDGINTGSPLAPGAWLNSNWRQLYRQIAYIVAAMAYSFVMSAILAYLINFIPGLRLRATEEAELLGMDDDQLGEFAYDYVEVRRDYLAWTPSKHAPAGEELDVPPGDRHGIPQHSQMIGGMDPNAVGTGNGGNANSHTGIGGDRHAVAIEKRE